ILERVKDYNSAHKEDKSIYDKQRRKKHRDEILRQKKLYYEIYKEWDNDHSKQYYKAHRDELRKKQKQYIQTEQGRMIRRAAHQRRRAKKLAVGGSYTAIQLQAQLKRQKSKCYWCH